MIPKFNHFILEEKDGIAYFTINRPEVLNAMNEAAYADLKVFANYLNDAEHLRVAIITGAGTKSFISGSDINGLATRKPMDNIFHRNLSDALLLLENGNKPVIAAINGYAFGGGFELALGCDIRIMSENAVVGLTETSLGIIPGGGGTMRLPRIVGVGLAKEMILAGRKLKAQEAYQFGLAMKVVPQENLLDEATNIAKKMIDRGPLAIALAKRGIISSFNVDFTSSMMLEGLINTALFNTKDRLEGTTAFLEKRRPDYKGE